LQLNIYGYSWHKKGTMDPICTDIRRRLKKPIVLIGLMGAGKTHVGRKLAVALDVPYTDIDTVIVEEEGASIASLFETKGEPYFRDVERKTIKRFLSGDVGILSPGGGAVMTPDTADLIWDKALSIWLCAGIDVLVERVSRNADRPLLKQGNPREILQNLMEKRGPVYARASISVNSESSDVNITVQKVLNALDAYLKEGHA
jgi:shikimate kinase